VSKNPNPSLILLFGQNTDHSFVRAKVRTVVARSGGPEPAHGQRSEGPPDPVFDAIENDKEATAAHRAALDEQNRLEKIYRSLQHGCSRN
jgi:hypothetical protein